MSRSPRRAGLVAVGLAVALAVLGTAPPTVADEGADPGATDDQDAWNGGVGRPPSSTGSTSSSSGSGPPRPPVGYERYFDAEGEGVGAEEGYEEGCWGIRAVEGGGGTWAEAQAAQQEHGDNDVLWGNCRVEDTVDPAVVAGALWRYTVRPPPPTPLAVDPGKALTGLRAYLEIGGEVPATETLPTPIGPVTFTMTPRFVVAWGDGTTTDTDSQGVPWPGGPGEVSHVYTEAGAVTITVSAYWRATWSLAGRGGDLPELAVPTEGSLDLPVEQRQVVVR